MFKKSNFDISKVQLLNWIQIVKFPKKNPFQSILCSHHFRKKLSKMFIYQKYLNKQVWKVVYATGKRILMATTAFM